MAGSSPTGAGCAAQDGFDLRSQRERGFRGESDVVFSTS